MMDALQEQVEKAAALILSGGIVAFPTETYYGLAVDPFNPDALNRLYTLKKRHRAKPVLTLIATTKQLDLLVSSVPDTLVPFTTLWPAPLTVVFPAHKSVASQLTGGTQTVGVRISANPIALALIKTCGIPITATSANISGHTPCHTSTMVADQFGQRLDFILDGGVTPGGAGSTLIGLKDNKPIILRDGIMPRASFEQFL